MKNITLLCLALMMSLGTFAQTPPDGQVPLNPDVIYGQLENGMTYYIQENPKPENRAELYLIVDAGAICEDPDQNGLAHFCEHMAFNGTEHFAKHDIVQYLQSIGMKFGPEINAFTSHDVTAYMLQKVPSDSEGTLDSAMLVLYDWASAVSYEDEEIDSERGVIHEEWRTGNGAQKRMATIYQSVLFQGSKYAVHNVIGDIDIVDNFDHDVIRRFYKDWYRPDLQAIIAVGDFNKEEMLKKVTALYGKIPAKENPRERIEVTIPEHEETLVSIVTDPEAQYSMAQIYYKHPATKVKDLTYYRQMMAEELYNEMLNARLSELLLAENPPFIYGYSAYMSMLRTMETYISMGVSKNGGQMDALRALLTENERLKQFGFTATELERTKKSVFANIEKAYNERDKQESSQIVWSYFNHFLEDSPAPGSAYKYQFAQQNLDGITLEEVNALAKEWITDNNRVVVITGPEVTETPMPTSEEVLALLAEVETSEITPYIDAVSNEPLVAETPGQGKIINEEKDETLGTTTWTFENGVKVVLKPTNFKADEILVSAFSMGGSSLYDVDYLPSAAFCTDIVTSSGIGTFDQITLDKLLAGTVLEYTPYIGGVSEGFNGACRQADLETLLKINYLYFTSPRVDKNSYNSITERMKGILAERANDPGSVFQDSLSVIMADHNPRVEPASVAFIDKVKKSRVKFIFEERFGDPSGFTFYFVGNIDPETVKPMMETWMGGLPTIEREEHFVDNNVNYPQGEVKRTIVRDMENPKSTVNISFTGDFDYTDAKQRLLIGTVADILSVRYVETVREEEGGSYGVGVWDQTSAYPKGEYAINMRFDCDPERVDALIAVIYREIELLKKEGPQAKDVNGVIENLSKVYTENQQKNKYWLKTIKNHDYYSLPVDSQNEYISLVSELNAKDIKKAAKRYLGKNCVEVRLMPSSMKNNVANPMKK